VLLTYQLSRDDKSFHQLESLIQFIKTQRGCRNRYKRGYYRCLTEAMTGDISNKSVHILLY